VNTRSSKRGSRPGRPPRPKRPSVAFLAAFAAGALMLAGPAFADSGILPDPTITPGAVRTTDSAEICSHGTRELRHWDRRRDDRILAEYGLTAGPHPQYEIDHLVSLCLGGADSDSNLWPQPRRSLEPIWNAERKDVLEARLCSLACSGQLDVAEAQKAIAEDWTAAFVKLVGEPRSGSNYLPMPRTRFSGSARRLRSWLGSW
jgi:hypothetical protein